MTMPTCESGYRLLEEHEKDGRYSNGRSEFWQNGWVRAGTSPTKSMVYRVSTMIHNPEGLSDTKLETTSYRHLKKDELDGRFNNIAEFYAPTINKWLVAAQATELNTTYRVKAKNNDNPQSFTPDFIDLVKYRLVTVAEKSTAKWAGKAEYWDTDLLVWTRSYCADKESVTYRLDRKHDLNGKAPVYPSLPEEFKQRHFTTHEIAETCALYGEVDIQNLLVYWNCKQVPGATSFYYDPPEPVKVLTPQEQLPEFFKYEELVQVLDSHSQALKLRNFGDIIEVPGSPNTWTFAPKKEVKSDKFELFKSAMNPMFSFLEAGQYIASAELSDYLNTGKIRIIPGTDKYEFTNN